MNRPTLGVVALIVVSLIGCGTRDTDVAQIMHAPPPPAAVEPAGPITVASFDFTESRIVAEIYAQGGIRGVGLSGGARAGRGRATPVLGALADLISPLTRRLLAPMSTVAPNATSRWPGSSSSRCDGKACGARSRQDLRGRRHDAVADGKGADAPAVPHPVIGTRAPSRARTERRPDGDHP